MKLQRGNDNLNERKMTRRQDVGVWGQSINPFPLIRQNVADQIQQPSGHLMAGTAKVVGRAAAVHAIATIVVARTLAIAVVTARASNEGTLEDDDAQLVSRLPTCAL